MKRYMVEVSKADKKFVHPKEPFLKDAPRLQALLCDPWWDDGSPREPCSLTIRVGVEQVQVSVNDKENECSITTTSETFYEAVKLLEEALSTGKNLWRKWGKPGRKK